MKIALVHDALINRGGAERVFSIFVETFPKADIYTSVYLPKDTYPFFSDYKIHTSKLQYFIINEKQFKLLFPLSLMSMRAMTLNEFDVVLSSSTFCAKYVTLLSPAIHICYCYTPFRLLWYPEFYLQNGSSWIKKKGIIALSKLFKKWDFNVAKNNVDYFISMTSETQKRIKNVYGKDSGIISPPIDCSKFSPSKNIDDFFLIVSRLEIHKKVDIVIKAFNKLGLNLKIVGDGTQKQNLKSTAKNNIEFLGKVSDKELRELYSKCQAVVFPQKEDYGLVPLEANASGRPVIAYGKGGIRETSIPYDTKSNLESTAIFFYEQSPEAVIEAINLFESADFDSDYLRKHALKFDKSVFMKNIRDFVYQKYQESVKEDL